MQLALHMLGIPHRSTHTEVACFCKVGVAEGGPFGMGAIGWWLDRFDVTTISAVTATGGGDLLRVGAASGGRKKSKGLRRGRI